MGTIGANMPRLHGFHRFLPRLWELFFAPGNAGQFAPLPRMLPRRAVAESFSVTAGKPPATLAANGLSRHQSARLCVAAVLSVPPAG
jgi:hypothetical protein